MKTIRLLLVSVLASISLAASAQSFLPQKSAFSIGGGFLWGIKKGQGDFQDVAGKPTCGIFTMEYRYYSIPNVAIGVAYNHLAGGKDGNKLRCNYIAPTLTLRDLWAENKQGFWATLGIGYFKYKDDLRYNGSFEKGYLGASFSVGYEFAISEAVGLQIRADAIAADFKNTGYRSCCHDNYYDNWDSSLSYFSLGMALVFGK